MKCDRLNLYSCLVIQIFCLLSVESISVDVPLDTSYPCVLTKDITVALEPGSRLEEINHLYIKINKTIPANSVVKASFNAEVNIFLDGKDKWTNMLVRAGDSMEVRFSETRTGFSFVAKGTAPGRANLTSLTIGDVEQCAKTKMISETQCTAKLQIRRKPEFECGRRIVQQKTVTHPISGILLPVDNGTVVDGLASPGHWPWHVAVYRLNSEKTQFDYACGGTLVSHSFVLTAARCVSKNNFLEKPEHALALSHSLSNKLIPTFNYSLVKENVAKMIVHEDYDYTTSANDIALLKLKTDVQFGDYLRPACLWYRRQFNKFQLANNTGVLTGWGYSDDDIGSVPLQQVNLPLVTDETCIKSYPTIYTRFLNGKSFCAGFAGYNAGPSPCGGDDGGALQLFFPDTRNYKGEVTSGAWYVRGIMSLYLSDNRKSPLLCASNYSTYAVFTDVDKYSVWIDSYLDADSS